MQIFVAHRWYFTSNLHCNMDISLFFIDLIKFTLAGLFVFFTAFFVLKNHFDSYYNLKSLEYKSLVAKDVLPLKLQAYERMTLFVERINPANMMLRLHQPGMSAAEIQALILAEVKAEYQHNITQQLYISAEAWNIIKRVKDDTIVLVNGAISAISQDATAVDLSKHLFAKLSQLEENPYDLAITVLRNDLSEL